MNQERLIFIISQPRAGSTALQLQLAMHNEIETLSEPWLLLPLLGMHKENFIKAAYNHELFIRTQEDYMRNLGNKYFDQTVRELILSQYGRLAGEKKYFLDKTPRYYEILPEIYRVFPCAKFIVLKRHPLDVLKSIVETWCQPKFENVLKYSRDIIIAPYQIQDFLNNYESENNVFTLKYEELLVKPNSNISAIFNFLNLKSTEITDKVADLKGVFGDQKKARKTQVLEGMNNTWSNLNHIPSRKYRRLAHSYFEYLGRDFLKLYGNYEVISHGAIRPGSRTFVKMVKRAKSNLVV